MRRIPLIILSLLLVGAFVRCGGGGKEKEMARQIDSLQNVNALSQMQYEDLQGYLAVIAESLDSISIEENELIVGFSEGPVGISRQRMKENVTHVREILAGHREKIAELEAKLANDNGQLKSLRTIVANLRQQIEQKDVELEQLRADLDNSKKDIRMLTSRVQEISEENEAKEATIQDQQETIQKQNEKINEANERYIFVGKKKELEQAGLLKGGGFLRGKKVDYSNINLNLFQKVNMYSFKQMTLPKKFDIRTEVPKDSYQVEKNGDTNTLIITNPERFWSVSNFLIIQDNTK